MNFTGKLIRVGHDIGHEDEIIHGEALDGIINARYLASMVREVLPHLSGSRQSFRRRSMLARIAQIAGPNYIAACRGTEVSNALDYEEQISKRKLQSIAEAATLSERYYGIAKDDGSTMKKGCRKRLMSMTKDYARERQSIKVS